MDIKGFFNGAREHLDVTWLVVTPAEGSRIDVGEEFDVQMSVRNTFIGGDDLPSFRDIELLITGTPYAEPTAPGVRVAERLGPGESAHPVVRFRALSADRRTDDAPREPIAHVRVRARLDMEALLDIETEPKVLRAQIHDLGRPE